MPIPWRKFRAEHYWSPAGEGVGDLSAQWQRQRKTRDVFIPLEPQKGPVPTDSVHRPLARWVKARRGRVEIGTFGPETLAGGAVPPGSVHRPLARSVKARRGRVEIGTFGPETLAPPPPPATTRRRPLKWFPGLARRR